MFSVCVVAELSVAATNNSPLFPPAVNTPRRRAKHAPFRDHLMFWYSKLPGKLNERTQNAEPQFVL